MSLQEEKRDVGQSTICRLELANSRTAEGERNSVGQYTVICWTPPWTAEINTSQSLCLFGPCITGQFLSGSYIKARKWENSDRNSLALKSSLPEAGHGRVTELHAQSLTV